MTHTNWRERFEKFDKNEDNHHACYECEGSLMPEKLVKFIQAEIDKAVLEERKRIVNGLFKKGHVYEVWIDGNELKVADHRNLTLKKQCLFRGSGEVNPGPK